MIRATQSLMLFLLWATPLVAQQPTARRAPNQPGLGFSLTGYTMAATGVAIRAEELGSVGSNLGAGSGLQLGYRFSPRLAAFAGYDLARQSSNTLFIDGGMQLSRYEIGGRLLFPTRKTPIVPYLTAFVAHRKLGADAEGDGIQAHVTFSGTEIGGGAGVLYGFAKGFALDASLLGGVGRLNHLSLRGNDADGDGTGPTNSSSAFRLKVGVQWTPK